MADSLSEANSSRGTTIVGIAGCRQHQRGEPLERLRARTHEVAQVIARGDHQAGETRVGGGRGRRGQPAGIHPVRRIGENPCAGRITRMTLGEVPAAAVLLDGASMWFRSYFGVPSSITAPDGRPVNAVRGFIDSMAVVITQQRPSRLVVCLDLDWRPQFRVDLIPSYKAHRVAEPEPAGEPDVEEVPDELTPQVDMIMELLDAFGIPTAGAPGFEADDVLGTLAAREKPIRSSWSAVTATCCRWWPTIPSRFGCSTWAGGWPKPPCSARPRWPRTIACRRIGPGRPTPSSRCCAAIRPTACRVCRASARRRRPPCWRSTVRWSSILAAAHDPKSKMAKGLRAKLLGATDYIEAAGPGGAGGHRRARHPVRRPPTRCRWWPNDPKRTAELATELGVGSSIARLQKALDALPVNATAGGRPRRCRCCPGMSR